MTSRITKEPEKVARLLFDALDKLIVNRIKDGAFTDEEEVTTRAYFSTLEGLEALLIPFVNLPKNLFWDPLKAKHPDLIDIMIDDVKFVLSFNVKGEMPPKEQGIPYFVQGKGVRQTPYWTSECASFTLSVLTNFLMLRRNYGLPSTPEDAKIINAINANLKWVKFCKRDIGWSWTTDSPSHPWPTWSLLDTFEEMINCDLLKKLHDEVTGEFEEILARIEKSFKTNIAGTYLNDWEERVINCKPYDANTALDITRLMLTVSLLGNRRNVKPLAKTLFSWASESNFENIDYNYYLTVRSDNISDSSLIPCVFRTILVMAGVLRFKGAPDLNDHLGQNHEFVLNRVYQFLMRSHIGQGKYAGLWGVGNKEFKYELYYTERTIESLTEFLLHYEVDLNSVHTEIEKEKKPKITTAKKPKEPKGKEVSDIVPAYLPVLDDTARTIGKEVGTEMFSNTIILFVLHFLNDLVSFVQKIYELGCLFQDMSFLVKTYSYPDKDKLIKHIQQLGCKVYLPDDLLESTFNGLAAQILQESIKSAERDNKRILIIEDGGYFAPVFHTRELIDKAEFCLGAVEQTTKGHRRDSKIQSPSFPIISIARSELKKHLEGQQVASTLQENIIYILNQYVKKPLFKVKALVLGFGNIGEMLSKELRNKKIEVTVYDVDPFKKMQAEIDKFSVLQDLSDLTEFHIIIGTSGETSLQSFWNLKHNVILVSGSSERVEFDLDELDKCSSRIERSDIIARYTLKKEDRVVGLILDGEPINFALSGGIPDSTIDPIYSEMLLCAVKIIGNHTLEKKLIDIPRELELRVLQILKNYYRT